MCKTPQIKIKDIRNPLASTSCLLRKAARRADLFSNYTANTPPSATSPRPSKKLVQGFKEGNQCQTLLGVTGSGKTFTMANVIQALNKPTLVLAHNETLAAQLYGEFKDFFLENAVEYFVSCYIDSSGHTIYSNDRKNNAIYSTAAQCLKQNGRYGIGITVNRIRRVNLTKRITMYGVVNPVFNEKLILQIDELELSVKNKKEFTRDIELVRDLIIAADRMNHIAGEKGYNIKIIASIRSEVINNVLAYGYEINKCVEDYGVNVDWFQKGGQYTESPLLKIIENKSHASEKIYGYDLTENVWDTYFAPQINEMEVRKYILSYSWQRPKDIV